MSSIPLFCLTVIVGSLMVQKSFADITVQKFENQTAKHIAEFDDVPAAGWGAALVDKGIVGKFASADPPDGCGPSIQPSPAFSCFALIRRGNCNFAHKALNAQKAGFQAAVIYNDQNDDLIAMSGGPSSYLVNIPAVFIGLTDGIFINHTFLYNVDDNVTIIIDGRSSSINWLDKYVWPFLGSVAFVFCLLLTFTIYKWISDRRRRRRNRLSTRKLKKIPLKKFVKGDPYDVCAICLDEYEEQDELRVLPCNHAYHAVCIDPWLTKTKRQCPICKRKVSPSGSENSSEASVRVHGSVDEDVPQSAEDNPLTTEDEAEDGEQGNGRADEEEEQRVDEETTPLILRGDDDEVEIHSPSFLTRMRNAWTSFAERRRRVSSQVTPAPVEGPSFGYGSFSEVPTEFNPTLPPPPARSFAGMPSTEVNSAALATQFDDSDEELNQTEEQHSATLHVTPRVISTSHDEPHV